MQSAGAGFDGVDIKAAERLGIPVANVPGQNAHSVAEYTIGLMIALQRCIVAADRETKDGHYTAIRQKLFQHELLSESDIVSLHIPLTDETRGCIGKKELMLMKSSSLLVNTARGEVVDQEALAEMLEAGRIAGAAVDVLSPDPPASMHPLLNLSPAARDRLLVTPHIAGVTVNSFRLMLCKALENIQRVLDGKCPENVVNGL